MGKMLRPDEPCDHPGCLSHVSHPCEGCGRIAGRYPFPPEIEFGLWPADDLRRAFVAGAVWWEYATTLATMWPADRDRAEAEAEKRYPGGRTA